MFRFTIRDVLWLTVVVGLVVLLWSERAALKKQRANSEAALATRRNELEKERAEIYDNHKKASEYFRARQSSLDREVQERVHHEVRKALPVADAELEATKRKSAELGAPQPTPLPPGYGETLNKE